LPPGNRNHPAELSLFRLVNYFAVRKSKTSGGAFLFPPSQKFSRSEMENMRQTLPFSARSNNLPPGNRKHPAELSFFRPVK
jgi:hypothetical protein